MVRFKKRAHAQSFWAYCFLFSLSNSASLVKSMYESHRCVRTCKMISHCNIKRLRSKAIWEVAAPCSALECYCCNQGGMNNGTEMIPTL